MLELGQDIFQFLHQYGYFVMLPLMVIEGPVVTIIAAMLASLGAFNVFAVFGFSVLGDLIGDVIFYSLGWKFGMEFVRGFGKYLGITESLVLKMEKYFARHGGKTIFAVKSTTGLCWATFTAAGIVKMDFKKFLKYSFYGGLVWSALLVALGYFYGYLWREIKTYIEWIGYVIFFAGIATIVIVNIWKGREAKRILAEKNNAEENE
ncbi:MAG: DedA family protein [Candidatus Pacebacteria bacterium]|nr:DedA family protein [Candidatus Paceibacterota bacterium]MDR3582986.1 DedA family protein [Candidatus Paceibacterota bacterium]